MHAALTDALSWLGPGLILPAGYAVAYPAMYWAMKREQKKKRCQHTTTTTDQSQNNNTNKLLISKLANMGVDE